ESDLPLRPCQHDVPGRHQLEDEPERAVVSLSFELQDEHPVEVDLRDRFELRPQQLRPQGGGEVSRLDPGGLLGDPRSQLWRKDEGYLRGFAAGLSAGFPHPKELALAYRIDVGD